MYSYNNRPFLSIIGNDGTSAYPSISRQQIFNAIVYRYLFFIALLLLIFHPRCSKHIRHPKRRLVQVYFMGCYVFIDLNRITIELELFDFLKGFWIHCKDRHKFCFGFHLFFILRLNYQQGVIEVNIFPFVAIKLFGYSPINNFKATFWVMISHCLLYDKSRFIRFVTNLAFQERINICNVMCCSNQISWANKTASPLHIQSIYDFQFQIAGELVGITLNVVDLEILNILNSFKAECGIELSGRIFLHAHIWITSTIYNYQSSRTELIDSTQ